MKRIKDPGLLYLIELKFNTYNNSQKGMKHLLETIGQEKTEEFFEWCEKRGNRQDVSAAEEIEFYDFKNQNLKQSLAISEVFDSDYIRRICNWVSEHKDLFGKKILDIGCDNGAITCFVARCLPDAKVVGIDRSENAVKCATELANKLTIDNVEFICSSVETFTGKFDTVICSRVTQENFSDINPSWFNTFFNVSEFFKKQIYRFITNILSFVSNKGLLISFEMFGANPLLYAMLRSLSLNGFNVINSEILKYKEVGDSRSVEVVISIDAQGILTDDFEKIKNEMIPISRQNKLMKPCLASFPEFSAFVAFNKRISQDMVDGAPRYFEWEANYMLDTTADELIEGYFLYLDTTESPVLYSQWTNINDETAIIYFGVPSDNDFNQHFVTWENHDISEKEENSNNIRSLLKMAIRSRHAIKITKITYVNGEIIENEVTFEEILEDDKSAKKWNPLKSPGDIAAYLKRPDKKNN